MQNFNSKNSKVMLLFKSRGCIAGLITTSIQYQIKKVLLNIIFAN